eukprot:403361751
MSQSRRQTQEVAGNTRSKSKSKTRTETQQQPKSKSKTRAKLIDSDEEEKSHIVARPNYDSKHRQIPSTSMTASKRKQHQRDEQEDDKEEAKAHQASSKHKPNQSKKRFTKNLLRPTPPDVSQIPQSIKVHDLNMYGKSEQIRMLLHHAGVEFEDIMYDYTEWDKIKKDLQKSGNHQNFEFGQVPAVSIDGEHYAQSFAILRMLGSIYGYYPQEDPREGCRVDELVYLNEDINDKYWWAIICTDAQKKEKMLSDYWSKNIQDFFEYLQKRIIENKHKFLCGPAITIADFSTISWAHSYVYNKKNKNAEKYQEILKDYSAVEHYFDRMTEQVQERLDNRFESEY